MNSCSADSCERAEPGATLVDRAVATRRAVVGALGGSSVRKGLFSVVDQAVVSATSFLTGVLVARFMSQEQLGVYFLILSLIVFARGLQNQLIVSPYMIYCHRRQGSEAKTYLGSVLIHQLGFVLVATMAVAVVTGVVVMGWGAPALFPAIAVLIVVLPVLLLREFARSYAMCRLKIAAAVAFDVVFAVLLLGTLLVMTLLDRCTVSGVYVVMGTVALVVCLGWLILEQGQWKIQRSQVVADWKYNWPFARWAMAGHLVGFTTPCLMPWLVAAICGEAAAGLFGACGTLVGVANMFVMGLGNFVAPKTAKAYADGGTTALARVLSKTLALYVGGIGAFFLVSLVAGQWLVVFVYGSEFAGGGTILTVLVLSVMATSVGWAAGNGIWAMDRPQATFAPDLCALVVTVIAAFLLVQPMGALGAALATLAGTVTAAVLKCLTLVQVLRSMALIEE